MYEPILNIYKSKREIDLAIEEFTSFRSKSYSEIKSKYFELFSIYPIPAINIDTDKIKDILSIYRSRPCSKNIDPFKKKSFSYPDNSDFSKTQRANWQNRNVFYGSDKLYTSLSETKLVYNENEFYVSKWGFDFSSDNQKKISLVPLGIGQLSENNPWKKILDTELNLKKNLKKHHSSEDCELIYHFYMRMGELFAKENEEIYPLTAFLADQILYHKSVQDNIIYFPILIYPSITNDFNSCNFAISPFFVNDYMRLEKVFKIKISEVSKEKLMFSYHQMGIEKSNLDLDWYKVDLEQQKSYYQFISISCKCGEKIDLNKINDYTFKMNDNEYNHSQLMSHLTKNIDLVEELSENIVIEEKEVLGGLMADYRVARDDVEIEFNGKKHGQLIFEFKFITPFNYEKIKAL